MKKLLLTLALLTLATLVGFRLGRSKTFNPGAVAATVNKEAITREEMDINLHMQRRQILAVLIEQMLINQEARKVGISVAPSELPKNMGTQDPELLHVYKTTFTAQLALSKLLLKDVTESEKKAVYDAFQDELRQYEVTYLVTSKRKDAEEACRQFKSGRRLREMVAQYSDDPTNIEKKGVMGWTTAPGIAVQFGSEARDALLDMKVGQISQPLPDHGRWVVLYVSGIHSKYEELLPVINYLIAESRRCKLIYTLTSTAGISSIYGTPPSGSTGVVQLPVPVPTSAKATDPDVVVPISDKPSPAPTP